MLSPPPQNRVVPTCRRLAFRGLMTSPLVGTNIDSTSSRRGSQRFAIGRAKFAIQVWAPTMGHSVTGPRLDGWPARGANCDGHGFV